MGLLQTTMWEDCKVTHPTLQVYSLTENSYVVSNYTPKRPLVAFMRAILAGPPGGLKPGFRA